MQFVPDDRADVAEDVSDTCCDNDECESSRDIKSFDHINRLDHVRPENEVDDPLCPAEQNEKRPN